MTDIDNPVTAAVASAKQALGLTLNPDSGIAVALHDLIMVVESVDPANHREDMVRHKMGLCPVCRVTVYADVTLLSSLRSATLDSHSKAVSRSGAEAVRCTIDHTCDKRTDTDPDDDIDFD